MRERTTIVWCCWLLGTGCVGQGGEENPVSGDALSEECAESGAQDCRRLDDACFATGRVIGLERLGEDCGLHLGLDTTGVWEETLVGCDEGTTAWLDLAVDADVPGGAKVLVSYRLTEDVLVPVGLPLQTIEGTGADLRAESGRYLDVRVELRSSPEGESPALHGVSVGRMCTN